MQFDVDDFERLADGVPPPSSIPVAGNTPGN